MGMKPFRCGKFSRSKAPAKDKGPKVQCSSCKKVIQSKGPLHIARCPCLRIAIGGGSIPVMYGNPSDFVQIEGEDA